MNRARRIQWWPALITWLAALTLVEAEAQQPLAPAVVVMLGDSITKGVRPGVQAEETFAALVERALTTEGIAAKVVNMGIGGERTDQALQRLETVAEQRPRVVVVMYGTNDSYVDRGATASRLSREAFGGHLREIVARLRKEGSTPLLMTEPRWADDAAPNGLGESPNLRLEKFMQICRQVAREMEVPLVDHFAHWSAAERAGQQLREWTTDGCHPNPRGHQELAATLLPVLRDALNPLPRTAARLRAGQAVRVVCLGDSVTGVYYHTGSRRAYPDMLGIGLLQAHPAADVHIINAGVSGHTTPDGLNRLERDVLAHQPTLVTVMFGLNDMSRVSPEEYQGNLQKIIERCRTAGAEVLLCTPNNIIDTASRPTHRLEEYCDLLREVGRQQRVPVCDCYRELQHLRDRDALGWRLLMSDEIHPNMDGHKRMAEALVGVITGRSVSLAEVPPPAPAVPRTLALIEDHKPVKILAVPPLDQWIGRALRQAAPDAMLEITTWPAAQLTLAQLQADAKNRVRPLKPDLVLLTIPGSASSASEDSFLREHTGLLNSSLSFGKDAWDCLVVHPAVIDAEALLAPTQQLLRQLVRAQDLTMLDRRREDSRSGEEILAEFLRHEFANFATN